MKPKLGKASPPTLYCGERLNHPGPYQYRYQSVVTIPVGAWLFQKVMRMTDDPLVSEDDK
jgi:hypothetical protein